MRLACQLRPQGDISVVPLVRTERPVYRATAPKLNTEREIVVLYCDFLNRAEVSGDQLPQDVLYVLTLYVEALGNAIRAARGTLSYIELDSVCALFGVDRAFPQAARHALQAGAAIERVIADINDRLGRQWDCKMKVAVTIHAGRAALSEIGQADPPIVMAIGEAVDVANALRKAAAAQDKQFAISEQVYAAAGLDFPAQDKITREAARHGRPGCGLALGIGPGPARVVAAARRTRPARRVAAALVRVMLLRFSLIVRPVKRR